MHNQMSETLGLIAVIAVILISLLCYIDVMFLCTQGVVLWKLHQAAIFCCLLPL